MLKKVLIIGYGNPGRMDDGLGPMLADEIEQLNLDGVTVDSNYQLNVEDSEAISKHDIVVFADASVDGREPFFFKKIDAKKDVSFSSHSISPEALLALAKEMFKVEIQAYALGIRGYCFNEFGQTLSDKALKNLFSAKDFIIYTLKHRDFIEIL